MSRSRDTLQTFHWFRWLWLLLLALPVGEARGDGGAMPRDKPAIGLECRK